MTFNKCSIRGKIYGYMTDEAGNEVQDAEVRLDLPVNDDWSRFDLEIETTGVRRERWRLSVVWSEIGRCPEERRGRREELLHTPLAMPHGDAGRERWQSDLSSPITGWECTRVCRKNIRLRLRRQWLSGVITIDLFLSPLLQSRTQNSITIQLQGEEQTYDLLNILDFNNDRKRMSVSRNFHPLIAPSLLI